MPDAQKIIPVEIENEMKESYLTYAMSVIVSRALPDVRDGLKPVHRRILYTMMELGLTPQASFKKSGRVVGDVLGKYHPHGDAAIYNSLVRMAQDYSLRFPLINGQGNFGSIDGDPPAAMRYTECKLMPIAMEMLRDIRKNTVDFQNNYDDSLTEPIVLPAYIPNLLINGAGGIAVGMATEMPPHNLGEVIDGTVALIDNPEIEIDALIRYIKGPDFPTAGIICGREGVVKAAHTGRGQIIMRGKVDLEVNKSGREAIIIKELPYQVNKATLIEKIAFLVKDKKIEGITALRDESDRKGMRVVIELKKSASVNVVLNQLYAHTRLQDTFNIYNLALVNGVPKLLNLKQILVEFVKHRKDVLIRRSQFDLEKAEHRAHILEGLIIAQDNIEEVIKLIRSSNTQELAKQGLIKQFKLTDIQATEILKMTLGRLVSLERDKIVEEHKEVVKLIAELKDLLASDQLQYDEIKRDLIEIKEKYKSDRRTIIEGAIEQFEEEDLIEDEDNVVTISHGGYIKRLPVSVYRRQKRGGIGVTGISTKNDDFVEHLIIASTHDYMLFITNLGRAFYRKVHELPEGSKTSRGKSVKLIFNLEGDEDIRAYVPIKSFDEETYIMLATSKGVIKKTATKDFAYAKNRGVVAIKLDEGDMVVSAVLTDGNNEVILCTQNGQALKYHENQVRCIGRATRGMRGIRLKNQDKLLNILKVTSELKMMVITEKGYGKTTLYDNFMPHNRGTGGQKYINITKKTGPVASVLSVSNDDDVVIITYMGMVVKVAVGDLPTLGRSTQGVKVISPRKSDFVVDCARVANEDKNGITDSDQPELPIEEK